MDQKSCFPFSETATSRAYIPALRYAWLTRLYDPLIGTSLKERKFEQWIVDELDLRSGQCPLDLGCGTATLTMVIKQAFPKAEVVGLDGAALEFVETMAFDIPFEDSHCDCVTPHRISATDKRRSLCEIQRILSSLCDVSSSSASQLQ